MYILKNLSDWSSNTLWIETEIIQKEIKKVFSKKIQETAVMRNRAFRQAY